MFRNNFFALLCMLVLIAGCGDDPGAGRLKLVLGDAPFPYDMVASAKITVDAVNVRLAADNEEDSGWVNFEGPGTTYDLLELQNGITADLVNIELTVGQIDQIRLVVSAGQIELSDGRSFDLVIPSGSSSGLKIFPRPAIRVSEGLTTEVLLDVDVSRSFQSIPSSPTRIDEISGFHFRPVLRVANLTTTGSVSGNVFSDESTADVGDDVPLEGATVMATAAEDTATAATDENGFYRILGLEAGSWKVVGSAMGFSPDSLDVDVVAGNDANGTDLRLTPQTN